MELWPIATRDEHGKTATASEENISNKLLWFTFAASTSHNVLFDFYVAAIECFIVTKGVPIITQLFSLITYFSRQFHEPIR